jgi:hypothetical protein
MLTAIGSSSANLYPKISSSRNRPTQCTNTLPTSSTANSATKAPVTFGNDRLYATSPIANSTEITKAATANNVNINGFLPRETIRRPSNDWQDYLGGTKTGREHDAATLKE